MPRSLPDNWSNLSVSDLGIKGSYPNNLKIKRVAKSKNLYASWLPDAEADTRPNQGRSGKTNKRVPLTRSMGTSDPFEAGGRAVEWVGTQQRVQEAQKAEQGNNLHAYWEGYFDKESKKRESTRGFARWKRDESLKWEGEGYGIKHQPWSNKPVDRINTLDLEDYWSVLDERRTPTNDMSGTKKQQKTLIRKLLTEARQQDFPHLGIPDFPEISSQKQQVRHLTKKEWDLLLKKVVELSEGAARKDLSVSDYQDLQFSKANNQNQRNWVDLYDCLNLMWFFYLRAEDLPRVRADWFQDRGEEIVCVLEITKGDRNKQETTHYRSDALENWRRMNQRRPTGFLVFPHTKRSADETNSTLKRTWNLLLRAALDACGIPSDGMTMTNIRHTAFRLTLEEAPELGQAPAIHAFAENGMTSAKMLQETYLRFIEQESTAKKVRAKIKPGSWSNIKRVGDDF